MVIRIRQGAKQSYHLLLLFFFVLYFCKWEVCVILTVVWQDACRDSHKKYKPLNWLRRTHLPFTEYTRASNTDFMLFKVSASFITTIYCKNNTEGQKGSAPGILRMPEPSSLLTTGVIFYNSMKCCNKGSDIPFFSRRQKWHLRYYYFYPKGSLLLAKFSSEF